MGYQNSCLGCCRPFMTIFSLQIVNNKNSYHLTCMLHQSKPQGSPNCGIHFCMISVHHVHLHTYSITAFNCICTHPWLQSQWVSPNSLHYIFKANLQTYLITSFQWIIEPVQTQPPHATFNNHNHSLQVHLRTLLISIFKSITTLAQLRPPSSHNYSLDVHLSVHPIAITRCSSISAQVPSAYVLSVAA